MNQQILKDVINIIWPLTGLSEIYSRALLRIIALSISYILTSGWFKAMYALVLILFFPMSLKILTLNQNLASKLLLYRYDMSFI